MVFVSEMGVRIFDISMEIMGGMLTYPGNPPLKIKRIMRIPKSKNNVSSIQMGSHTGTHVDSGLHIRNKGKGADSLPLGSLYGDARVLDVSRMGNSIGKEELSKFDIRKGEIILLKTNNSLKQYSRFRKDFAHVSIDGARYLASRKVRTLGVDYLSVKRFGGDDIVHNIIIENMTLFEGLCLKGIREGAYTFAGLPLRIDCDGSPARAILIQD